MEFKQFEVESFGGFYILEAKAAEVFEFLWAYLATTRDILAVSSTRTWKLKFELEQAEEKRVVPADEDFSEDEETIPAAQCDVEINLRALDEEDSELVYVEFIRKSGDAMLYSNWVK